MLTEESKLPALPVIGGMTFRYCTGWVGYCVSDAGVVMSCRKRGRHGKIGEWRELKPASIKGQPMVWLAAVSGKKRHVGVHTLVLTAFVGDRPPGMMGRHTPDPNPWNNAASNLKWGTAQQNAEDCIAMGRRPRGSTHHLAVLSEQLVKSMRDRHNQKGERICQIARDEKLNYGTAYQAIKGKMWKHV